MALFRRGRGSSSTPAAGGARAKRQVRITEVVLDEVEFGKQVLHSPELEAYLLELGGEIARDADKFSKKGSTHHEAEVSNARKSRVVVNIKSTHERAAVKEAKTGALNRAAKKKRK